MFFWNIILSATVAWLFFPATNAAYPWMSKIGYGENGRTIIHGPRLPPVAGGDVSSTIHNGGAITRVEYSDAKVDDEMEPERSAVTQAVGMNGASLRVAHEPRDTSGKRSVGIQLIAGAERSDSLTNGAKINISDAEGGYITLGFTNDHRPFLKAVVGQRERVWWLLEGTD